MEVYEEIQQKLAEIDEISRAADHIKDVMSNPHSTNEDVEQATQEGIRVLEEIESRRNTQ